MTWKEEINEVLWARPTTVRIGDSDVKVSRDILVTLLSIERDIDQQEITDETAAALRSVIERLQIARRILERG